MLTIRNIIAKSISRANRWHVKGIDSWSELEWAGAMAGEAGEACNAAKKVKRITDEMANRAGSIAKVELQDLNAYRQQTCKESADTILYAILCILRCGGDPETVLREVFNKKSEEYGFPERL